MGHNMFTHLDLLDGECTLSQYVDQFKNTAKDLQVGSVYVQHPNTWQESKFRIVFKDKRVALGVEITGCSIACGAKGGYTVFISSGIKAGWKHSDNRSTYRLQILTN